MLYFPLSGVLQSYGTGGMSTEAKRTGDLPTKSAVVSMLSIAGGFPEDYSSIDSLSSSVAMSVIVHRPGGRLLDYQTVTRYMTGDGAVNDGTKILKKGYIVNGGFTVVIDSDDGLLREMSEWLSDPRGVISLGRFGCVPSTPITPTLSDEYPAWRVRYVECLPSDAGSICVYDNYLSSRTRLFGPRWIREETNDVLE